MKTLMLAVMTLSTLAVAAPPSSLNTQAAAGGAQGGWNDGKGAERREEFQKRMRLMLVVGIAEHLNMSEGEAIRLADKMKVFDDRRKPLREQMGESMKTLKAAADGDQASLGKVDQVTMSLLDTRAQMAAIDKEMFITVSKDLTPQKRAQLALFLAKFMHEAQGMKHGGGEGMHGGRRAGAN